MKTTRGYFTLAAVVLLAGTACSADEAEAEPQEEPAQSQAQTQDQDVEEAPDSKHPQETETLPPADDSGYDPIPEFEHSIDGGAGTTSITETHIEVYGDLVAFMDEQGIVADESDLEDFGAARNYGRAATELEYWGEALSLPNHNDGGDMSLIEVHLQPGTLDFETDERSEREELADDLIQVIAETPHIDGVRDATVIIGPSDGVGQVRSTWTEEVGYSFDR